MSKINIDGVKVGEYYSVTSKNNIYRIDGITKTHILLTGVTKINNHLIKHPYPINSFSSWEKSSTTDVYAFGINISVHKITPKQKQSLLELIKSI